MTMPIEQPTVTAASVRNSRRSRGESFGSLPSASSPLTTGSSLDRVSASSPSRRLTEPSQSKLSVDSRKSGKGLTESCTPASSVRHGFDPKIAPVSVVPISSKSGGPQSKGLLSSSLAGTRQPSPEAVLQEALSKSLSASANSTPCESQLWQRAKKDGELKTLYNPVVHRAHVIAAVVQAAGTDSDTRQSACPLEQLEQTAIIVAKLGLGAEVVAAALLQDALEHPGLTDALLTKYMPEEVVQLVAGLAQARTLSGLYREHPGLREEATTEKLRMMMLALGDARVMLVVLAHHLAQARNLECMPARERMEFVLSTEALYAPLANRLGVWSVKSDLEDLCFKAMRPQAHDDLSQQVERILRGSNATISEFMGNVDTILRKQGIEVEDIEGRPKSLASIRSKQAPCPNGAPSKPLESIHDVLAVRVIVPTKADCYAAMRSICKQWQPVDGREKNYIRDPKPNGYRSLHNVVITGDNVPIEVQVRTPQMHWEAEFGLAAHWRYKENVEGGWDMHVAWSRMMLLYCFGMRDYGKKTLSGLSAGSRLLREMTQGLMDTSGSHTGITERMQRSPGGKATMSTPCARKGWMEHVKKEMQPPKPLANVLVVVATAQCARIQALPAVMGASTVAELQAHGALPAGCNISQMRVNGVRSRESAHPIYMGDVVTVVPDLMPAMLRNPLHVLSNVGAADAPFGGWNNLEQMQREVFGVVLGALRGKPGPMGPSKDSRRDIAAA